jgi:hypothetical protein
MRMRSSSDNSLPDNLPSRDLLSPLLHLQESASSARCILYPHLWWPIFRCQGSRLIVFRPCEHCRRQDCRCYHSRWLHDPCNEHGPVVHAVEEHVHCQPRWINHVARCLACPERQSVPTWTGALLGCYQWHPKQCDNVDRGQRTDLQPALTSRERLQAYVWTLCLVAGPTTTATSRTPFIIGGIIGAIVLVGLAVIVAGMCMRRCEAAAATVGGPSYSPGSPAGATKAAYPNVWEVRGSESSAYGQEVHVR